MGKSIGIVGGTGREGQGLALRLARAGNDVFIGSRDAARGTAKAQELSELHNVKLRGGDNFGACAHGDIVIVTVPYTAHRDTFVSIASALSRKIVVDITVPLAPPKVREVHLPEGQSAALEAQSVLGNDVQLVAALHHISSDHLGDPAHSFECDVLVCSDYAEARSAAIELIADLGLRGIDAGVLRNAIALESLTPVLLHINKHYKAIGAGIRVTGVGA